MLDLIDDDEWFELGLALSNTMARLPTGSTLIESLQIPPFRLASSATGTEMPQVITRPCLPGIANPADAVRAAIELAQSEPPITKDALSIAVTQTDDGEHYAIAIVGIAGESKSFITFGLGPGGHSIDVAYLTLEQLEGWGIFRNPEIPIAA